MRHRIPINSAMLRLVDPIPDLGQPKWSNTKPGALAFLRTIRDNNNKIFF
jgi:hypothetical protein